MISFFVPGVPKSTQTGSVITIKGRSFPLRRNTPWATTFGIYARGLVKGEPLDGALECIVTFVMPRPQVKRKWPTVRPDTENLWKGLGDQLNGVAWHDDAQVIRLWLIKRYTDGADDPVGVNVDVAQI